MVQPKVDIGTGTPVPVDAITVTVRINGRDRSATVTPHTFEKNGVGYGLSGAKSGHRVRIDDSDIGRRVLEAAGVDHPAASRAGAFRQLSVELAKRTIELDQARNESAELRGCLADAFADYCSCNPDPDHLPEAWVEVAQELLGGAEAAAIYRRTAADAAASTEGQDPRQHSPRVMCEAAAFELVANFIAPVGAEASRLVRDVARARKRNGAQAAIVDLPPRAEWPHGMSTESVNGEPRVRFYGWLRTTGYMREIAAALLAAADESERAASKQGGQ